METWVFFALFQPLISFIIFDHGFAKLNLAIERDVDQVRRAERRVSKKDRRGEQSEACRRKTGPEHAAQTTLLSPC